MYDICQSLPVKIFESGAQNVSAADKHSLARMENGDLWGWGANTQGFLLESDEPMFNTPQLLLTEVNLCCAANGRSFAIREDDALWSWGNNEFQAMDFNYKADYISAIPKKIMNTVTHMSSGSAHTMAVQTDGTLWGWGDNSYGQLAQDLGPVGLPVRIRVEYPAWVEESEQEEANEPETEAEVSVEPLPAEETEHGSPLPFIIGCAVIAAGGAAALIIWRKKRRGAVG